MLKNYLKVALRNLRKHKGYTLINVGGLGLGLACCFLIVLFIQHERSFDRFHEKADRIYRLTSATTDTDDRSANTPAGFAVHLKERFPEIEEAVRIETWRSPFLKVNEEQRRAEDFLLADDGFFDVFTFPFVKGDPATALSDPYSLVLTERTAEALFGAQDPIGKTVAYNNSFDLTVTGVIAEVPENSHFRFNYVAPFSLMRVLSGEGALEDYSNINYFTYLLLRPGADPAALEAKSIDVIRERVGEEVATKYRLLLQPLSDIHFNTSLRYDVGTSRDIRYLYLFAAIGLFILLIACVNFMNLATARATQRAKEVGVRKVVGAQRGQLIGQFLGESLVLSLVAIVLAVALTALCLGLFNEAIGSNARFGGQGGVGVLLVGIGLFAGMLAGSYPAFYLSAFRPALVLRGEVTRSPKAAALRKGLIVLQFGISVFLIVTTITVYHQLHFMRSQDLGFDREQVISFSPPRAIWQRMDSFKREVQEHPNVVSVALSGAVPGRVGTNRGYNWPGAEGDEQGEGFWTIVADPGYVETLGLELVQGRNFSYDIATDTQDTYILNEAAVRRLGIEDPVDAPFRAWDRPMGKIIGVVKDFHFQSLHQQIEPIVINMKPDWFGTVSVRVAPQGIPETLQHLQSQWQAFAPGFPFEYRFLDEDFDRLYRAEERLGQLFGFFAAIAIFIACLGLFGLAAFSAERRRKEIGVRKVLGASVRDIVLLLSKEFTLLVLGAFVLAAPLAWYAMNQWLESFAYRVSVGVGTLALTAVLALAVAWLTVSYQALRAATADPVKSLRYE